MDWVMEFRSFSANMCSKQNWLKLYMCLLYIYYTYYIYIIHTIYILYYILYILYIYDYICICCVCVRLCAVAGAGCQVPRLNSFKAWLGMTGISWGSRGRWTPRHGMGLRFLHLFQNKVGIFSLVPVWENVAMEQKRVGRFIIRNCALFQLPKATFPCRPVQPNQVLTQPGNWRQWLPKTKENKMICSKQKRLSSHILL